MGEQTPQVGLNEIEELERDDSRNSYDRDSNTNEWAAIVLKPEDHVATALRRLKVGEHARIKLGNEETFVHILEEIPLCHKFAVSPIEAGQIVLKYGYQIGKAVSSIPAGNHVHVHNLESNRTKPLASQ